MAGLRNIARAYGGMTINGVRWVWDYAADEPVRERDMPFGSDRWKVSEIAKAQGIAARSDQTRSGSAEGKSPAPSGCAQTGDPS